MKRILFMHQVSTIGGASYCMLSILRGLDRSKFEPVMMLCTEGPLADEFRKLNVEVCFFSDMATVPYNQSLLQYDTLWYYVKMHKSQNGFLQIIKKLNIDIVYLNNMMLYPYLKTAKEFGCKTIMHVREHWPEHEHQWQLNRARKYAEKYADALIAINRYSASMFSQCMGKITIVYDWFDAEGRYEAKPFSEIFGEDFDKLKVILFTGGIGRIKGTHEVLRTFKEHIQGDEYRLLMMGSGLDYELSFEGLSGMIKKILMLTGWKPYGYRMIKEMESDKRIVTIPPTYNMTDIYKQAFFTISYYTIPHANLALAEAVSLGTVGIAARTAESIEYTNEGKGAVLFEINDREDFMNKIDFVIKHYTEVKEHIVQSADRVKEMFLPETNVKKINEVCEQVSYS